MVMVGGQDGRVIDCFGLPDRPAGCLITSFGAFVLGDAPYFLARMFGCVVCVNNHERA